MGAAFTVSIDVPDIEQGVAFFRDGLGFRVRRRMTDTIYELEYAGVRAFLLQRAEGSNAVPGTAPRAFARHWTPVHLDLEVADIESAVERAVAAGAVLESRSSDATWGHVATLADPFGHGFCLIEPPAR